MLRPRTKLAESRAVTVGERKVFEDEQRTVIQSNMVVRTQANHVLDDVWRIVTLPERQHVRGLGVRAGSRLKADATHLASKVVDLLHSCGDFRISDEAIDGAFPSRWSALRWSGRMGSGEASQPKSTDAEATLSRRQPRLLDSV